MPAKTRQQIFEGAVSVLIISAAGCNCDILCYQTGQLTEMLSGIEFAGINQNLQLMKQHHNRRGFLLRAFTLLFFHFFFCSLYAQPVIGYQQIPITGQSSVVDFVNAGDGTNRIFLVQQTGTIRLYDGNFSLLNSNFLTIPDNISTGGERGLLSLVFHPSFETNRYFFVYYTNSLGGINIDRFQTLAGNPNQADVTTRTNILTIDKPVAFTNHNGGDLNFGPDGNLYAGLGDAGSGGDPRNYAQRGDSLWGKMIRINVDNFTTPPFYTIPPDNPYISDPLIRDEIWALGLRNPWRWSFDRATGDMWIADVGQGNREEINFRPAASTGGINYGWRCYEGTAAFNTGGCAPQGSYTSPIFDYPHNSATGGFSVTGGYVYRGAEFPALTGYYICADFVSANTWLIQPDGLGGWNVRLQAGLPGNISSFGETEDGTLYAVALGGAVYKIVVTAVLPAKLGHFAVQPRTGFNEVSWKTLTENNLARFNIEYSFDGTAFQPAGEVIAQNNPSGGSYMYQHTYISNRKIYYRLAMVDRDGNRDYSSVVLVDPSVKPLTKLWPTLITDGKLNLQLASPFTEIIVTNASGQLLLKKQVNGNTGLIELELPAAAKGYHFVILYGKGKNTERYKIFIR